MTMADTRRGDERGPDRAARGARPPSTSIPTHDVRRELPRPVQPAAGPARGPRPSGGAVRRLRRAAARCAGGAGCPGTPAAGCSSASGRRRSRLRRRRRRAASREPARAAASSSTPASPASPPSTSSGCPGVRTRSSSPRTSALGERFPAGTDVDLAWDVDAHVRADAQGRRPAAEPVDGGAPPTPDPRRCAPSSG